MIRVGARRLPMYEEDHSGARARGDILPGQLWRLYQHQPSSHKPERTRTRTINHKEKQKV